MSDMFKQMPSDEAALMSLSSDVDVNTSVEPKVINIQYIYADHLTYHE